jgi:hypothetical protein
MGVQVPLSAPFNPITPAAAAAAPVEPRLDCLFARDPHSGSRRSHGEPGLLRIPRCAQESIRLRLLRPAVAHRAAGCGSESRLRRGWPACHDPQYSSAAVEREARELPRLTIAMIAAPLTGTKRLFLSAPRSARVRRRALGNSGRVRRRSWAGKRTTATAHGSAAAMDPHRPRHWFRTGRGTSARAAGRGGWSKTSKQQRFSRR